MVDIASSQSKFFEYYIKSCNLINKEGYANFFKIAKVKFDNCVNKKVNSFLLELEVAKIRKTQQEYQSLKQFEDLTYFHSTFNKSNKVACTIVSKNYLPMAFVLAKSFKKHNRDWDFKILLCDMIDEPDEFKYIYSQKEAEIIPISSLPNYLNMNFLESMCYKYTVLELNTAIKPFFLEHLFKLNYEKVIYLDPDIYIFHKFDELDEKLNDYDILLTPHILTPLPDDEKRPCELDILRSGVYNLGFIALKNCDNTTIFLKWWQKRLKDFCFMRIEEGMHVDQNWIDFVPSFFDNVYILKSKSYNAAYWNLHERKIHKQDGSWFVEGENLVFYHFSGFLIDDLNSISKHQNRFSLRNRPEIKELFTMYKIDLLNGGIYNFKKKPYWYGLLPGTDITLPDAIKTKHKDISSITTNVYNPDNVDKFISFCNEIVLKDPPVSRLWFEIYEMRKDLKEAFPNLHENKNSRSQFFDWIKISGIKEHNINEVFNNTKNLSPYNNLNPKFGINIYGYFNGAFGVAETARVLFETITCCGVPFCLTPINSDSHEKLKNEKTINIMKKYFSFKTPYKINLLVVNADQTPHVIENIGREKFNNKYNIGLWAWEIENYFPFRDSFNYVDEVWYFSNFACETYRKFTSKPVRKITYPFYPTWGYISERDSIRQKYGIKDSTVVFFYNFDFHSSYERKNPEGVMEAFKNAFPEGNEDVLFICKSIHAKYHPKEAGLFKKKIENNRRILWIDENMSKEELISVLNASDCYVSLHRSEGLGLGLIEAMYLGKCTIGTAYGGNMEFMNNDNSLLVSYTMKAIEEDFGPYKKGELWADPDIPDAINLMREVYFDQNKRLEIGKKAAEDIRNNLNPKKTIFEISQCLFSKKTDKILYLNALTT